ncbi:YitT family protein [Fusobacterium sp.]|uniref:YitT family protein n=1 Tax=Fusobacterium sp. TaxID=68766 RepID=UPI0026186BE6|nr:YitT family protein [Fusobacterium sp.]
MRKELMKDILLITVGAFIYAFGVNYFFVANKLADGGLAGISVILHYLFNFNISITYLILNIPLIIMGYKLIGGQFILKTFYGTAMTSLAFRVFQNYLGVMEDKLIASIFGGLIIGIGLGTIFVGGGSSGGSDILVKILNKYFDIPIGKAFLALDFLVLSALGLLFGKDIFMYTLVGLFISTKAIDFIQDGLDTAKAVIIISDESEKIKDEIMKETGRGVTILNARGGYTNDTKNVLYCIVGRYEVTLVKRIVKNIDRKAFMSISEVSEVLGEGFKDITK